MGAHSKDIVAGLLSMAGIELNGDRPFDPRIHNEALYDRVLARGTLGLGEAYMDAWWDCDALDELACRLMRADIFDHVRLDFPTLLEIARSRLLNLPRLKAGEVGERHYDIGNELYEAMLDKRMIYSCGYWPGAGSLDQAQEQKLDLICRKIGLTEGQHILDIGSGWGGLLMYAAETYGASATGVTISRRQAGFANARRGNLPVETLLQDYQTLDGRFDHIVSVGMFEHVGYKNYRRFLQKAASLLAEDGLFVLHTIGGNRTVTHGDPWMNRYIFPNGMVPSLAQIAAAAQDVFVIEDVHNIGAGYDPTLMAWHENFVAAWPTLASRYGERFHRMWRYYLMLMAGAFRSRRLEVWQIVMSKNGVPGGYRSVR